MIASHTIENGKVIAGAETPAMINVFINPDEQERRTLVDQFGVDEHTLLSALDPDELSRLEQEPDHWAMIFKAPRYKKEEDRFLFRVSSIGVFLFKERILIVLSEERPLFEGKDMRQVSSLPVLMVKLIYQTIIHFREHLKVINMISDDLQAKIARAMENRVLLNMFSIQKSLEYYLNAINSNALLLEKLRLNATRIGFTTEQLEILDDIVIENTQCARQAEIYANILASLMDARASIVSNNLNVLMKTLTIITICIMVPTFVVSAFSMNVHIPLENYPHAFYVILSLALLSIGVVVFLWRALKW